MPTPIIANVCKVTVIGTLFGQDVENVWYVGTTGAPDPTEMSAIAGTFQSNYTGILGVLSQDLAIGEINVRYMGDVGGPDFTLAITPAQTGAEPVGSEPGNVCLCVSLRSALAGRRFRGRKYFSGLPTGSVVANTVDAPLANAVVIAVNQLITDLAAGGTPLQVVSFVGLTSVPVLTAIVTDLFSDSQRRRLTGRGR